MRSPNRSRSSSSSLSAAACWSKEWTKMKKSLEASGHRTRWSAARWWWTTSLLLSTCKKHRFLSFCRECDIMYFSLYFWFLVDSLYYIHRVLKIYIFIYKKTCSLWFLIYYRDAATINNFSAHFKLMTRRSSAPRYYLLPTRRFLIFSILSLGDGGCLEDIKFLFTKYYLLDKKEVDPLKRFWILYGDLQVIFGEKETLKDFL